MGFFMRLACKLGKSHNYLFFFFLADDENSTTEPTAKLKSSRKVISENKISKSKYGFG